MKNLEKYSKIKKDPTTITRSVNITVEQKEFVDSLNINLSSLIRDYLETLRLESIKQTKKAV